MGLDTIEIVLSVEEAFGITLATDDLQSIKTVGDLHDLIIERVELAPPGAGLAQKVFHQIQAKLHESGAYHPLKPSTNLNEKLPQSGRRRFWRLLEKRIGLRLPNLVRPNWLYSVNALATIVTSTAIAFFALSTKWGTVLSPIIGIISLFVVGYLVTFLTAPLAIHFDPTFSTLQGLAERVLALNLSNLKNDQGAFGRRDVWPILREIIVDSLGVDHDEVVPKARLIEDLGCE